MNPLERFDRLVQLAASAPEHEARNAAVQACELVLKHDLLVVPRSEYERVIKTAIALRKENDALREQLTATVTSGASAEPPRRRRRIMRKDDIDVVEQENRRRVENLPDIVSSAAGRVVRSVVRDVLGGKR